MQTILGSGGAIGVELAKALKSYTSEIRLVSRNPQRVNETDEIVAADLTDAEDVRKAVKGSEIVYVTIGFKYDLNVWRETWPKFMKSVIDACEEFGSKLVFFDNIYMYDPNFLNGMTEETPVNPSSKKGKVRAHIAQMIMDEVNTGRLKALIARSADFYGPGVRNTSMLHETVIKPLSAGKKATLLSSGRFKHTYTYTPDAGKATAILGNTGDAYNQVWHLPTAGNPLTGKQWVDAVATEFGVKPKFRIAGKFIVKIMGIFVPVMREVVEMMYQNDRDYIFGSSKFEKRFNFNPTTYPEGIREVRKADYGKNPD
jgi:nucleoside-diphosphate-sugar epimerase